MGRGAVQNAETNTGIGRANAGTLMGEGQGIFNTIAPQLTQQAAQGFDPATLAALNTASQQSLGGANAAAQGQGALTEARTRNAGASNAMQEESARNAMRQGSQNAMNIQGQNWNAKQAALQALQGLYGTTTGAANQALGLSNQAIGDWNQASAATNAGWQGLLGAVGQLGGAAIGKYCWVAASFYGWNSPKTHIIRQWIMNESPVWFMEFYIKRGEQIAKTAWRWLFRPVFEVVLWVKCYGR